MQLLTKKQMDQVSALAKIAREHDMATITLGELTITFFPKQQAMDLTSLKKTGISDEDLEFYSST